MRTSEAYVKQLAGLRRMSQTGPVRVIAVTSGKGGVGKTNVSTNLAVSMAMDGTDVLLMDADMGLANVDVLLGLQPLYNLSHVISGMRTVEEIMITGPGDLKVIPASSGIADMADLSEAEHAGLIRAFSELSFNPQVLLIDTPAGIANSVVTYARAAHEVIVVVCDEPASITDAYAMIKLLNRDHGIARFRILANMVHSTQEGVDLYKKLVRVSDRYLDATLDYIGAIPFDEYLRKAVQRQKVIVEAYPRSKSALAFKKAAGKVMQWPVPDSARGCIEFFVERLFKGKEEDTTVTMDNRL